MIGGGWAGRLVENGVDAVIHDPHPEAPRRVHEMLANAERAWARLTIVPRRRGTVTFADSVAEAVAGASVVQESAPEDEVAEAATARGDRPARTRRTRSSARRPRGCFRPVLQADMARPERFVVGHPFNPVYLLPLVEVVAGEQTAAEAVDAGVGVLHLDRDGSAARAP